MKKIKAEISLFQLILLCIVIIVPIVTNLITLKLYLHTAKSDSEQIDDWADEISRTKYFIKDWYDELSAGYDSLKIYKNELSFEDGSYSLTVAADRIRAVYPRGERYFQLENISYIDFFELNQKLQCRIYYGENDVYTFYLKNES